MEHYKANMDFLGKQLKPIFRKINEFEDDGTQTITWSEKHKTFLLEQDDKKIYMQSIYNQKREVANIVENKPLRSKVVVIFSMINIYLVKEICKNYKEVERIVIVEPNVKFFKNFISKFNLVDLLSKITDVQISIVLSADIADVEMTIKGFLMTGAQNTAVFASLAYQNLYPYYFKELCEVVKDSFITKQINANTNDFFSLRWQINSWRSMNKPTYSAYELQSLIVENTCVLVAAGPSLQKNIDLIEELKEKAVVFAVGSAVNILKNKNITPHFIVNIDGGDLNNVLYSDLIEQKSEIPLIFHRTLYYNIVKKYQGPMFEIAFSNSGKHSLSSRYFYKKDYKVPVAEPGFSVANVLHRLLVNLGCRRVIFMGQDLCYTGNKLHSAGAWSDSVFAIQEKENLLLKKNIYDEDVYTDSVLWGVKEGFDETIARMKEQTVHWNATEGGLEIIGAENKKMRELLDNELALLPKRDFTAIIKEIVETGKMNDISDTYIDSVERIKTFMEKIEKIHSKQKKALEQIVQAPNETLKYRKIKYLAELNKKLFRIEYYQEIIQPILNVFLEKIDFANKNCYSQELLESWVTYIKQLELYINVEKNLIEESLGQKDTDFIFKE